MYLVAQRRQIISSFLVTLTIGIGLDFDKDRKYRGKGEESRGLDGGSYVSIMAGKEVRVGVG